MMRQINEAMFEWAKDLQNFFDRGWRIVDMDYGDYRYGLGPTLHCARGEEKLEIRCPEDVSSYLSEEYEKEQEAKWSKK